MVTAAVAASAAAPGLELPGALAAEDERGRMIGTVLSGLLTGILLSRTFAGIVAQVAGWRGVYAIAAVVMAATTVTVYRGLPDLPKEIDAGYGAQLREVFNVARKEPILRWRSLTGVSGFGAFSAFWTTISFLLADPDYRFSQLDIGLFALAGTAGALVSALAGPWIDTRPRLRWPVTGVVLAIQLGSFVLIGLGGALGSWAAAHAYQRWGWTGACVAAAAFPAAGLLCWLAARRHEVRGPGHRPRRLRVLRTASAAVANAAAETSSTRARP